MFDTLQEKYLNPRKPRNLRRLEALAAIDAEHTALVANRFAAKPVPVPSEREIELQEALVANDDRLAGLPEALTEAQQKYSDKVAGRARRLALVKARLAKIKAGYLRVDRAVKKAARAIVKVVGLAIGTVIGTVIAIPVFIVVGIAKAAWAVVTFVISIVLLTFYSGVALITGLFGSAVDVICAPFIVARAIISAWRSRTRVVGEVIRFSHKTRKNVAQAARKARKAGMAPEPGLSPTDAPDAASAA